VFRQGAEGDFYFIDRAKDVILRWEEISSFELENEYRSHPAVRDTAAVAVPDAHGEDEPVSGTVPVPAEPGALRRRAAAALQCHATSMSWESFPVRRPGKIERHRIRSALSLTQLWDQTPDRIRSS